MARIYFSGASNIYVLRTLAECGVRNMFFSYFYLLRRGQLTELFALLKDYPDIQCILDSGAFTYRQHRVDPLKRAFEPPRYFQAYKEFIRQFGHRFIAATEFDIEGYQCLPQAQIDVWRDELWDVGTCAIVPVWHDARGPRAWVRYCEDPRYTHLAIGQNTLPDAQKGRLVALAHQHDKTVFGFDESKLFSTLKYAKYDGVTSGAWMAGASFGTTYIMKGSRFITLGPDEKNQRWRHRKYFESIGCEPARILMDNEEEVTKANIVAWKLLSDQLERMYRPRINVGIKVLRVDGTIAYVRPEHGLMINH